MSSTAAEEIELLERVLLRLGVADTDEKLEATVGRFLTPVIIKITSPHDNVRMKVVEVLTHIKRRVTSRPLVQIPVESLLDQYKASGKSPFLQNFAIIFITMGFPRLPIEKQTELANKLIACEEKLENYQDRLFMLLLPLMGDMKIPDDPAKRKDLLSLDDKPEIKKSFLALLQDVLLVPYGSTNDVIPAGLSPSSFKRINANNWKAEELEKIKQGIVRFICTGIFSDLEIFILLVIASSDTRFSVATPAIAELSKVCTMLDFTDGHVTAPLYTLFSGNNSPNPDRKTTPCCARVRQKLLQYLIKARGKGINTPKGIQVIFEGLFGEYTNQKCRVLALQFCEILIKEGPIEIVSKVAKVILTGLSKLIGREADEPVDVQNAAYSALAQLSRTCPNVINQDLKIVLSYFNHLANAQPELHTSIREALVSMAPAFAYNSAMETDSKEDYQLDSQQHLLLAMLADNAESKLNIVQNVTSVFLTTCFPEHFAPARFLLLLIAGERNSLRETVTSYLYGVSKKDQVNYNYLSSIDFPEGTVDDFNKLSSEQRRVVIPGFKPMMRHVAEVAKKRLAKSTQYVVVGRTKLAFNLNVYEEILDYLRVCLWFSAGVKGGPGDEKNTMLLKNYIMKNFAESEDNEIHQYLQLVQKSVEAKRSEVSLLCLYDLLNAAPEILAKPQMHLMESLANSLKDVSETTRLHVAQVYGILLAYGTDQKDFDSQISEILSGLPQKSLENRHGWLLVLGHAYSRRIESLSKIEEKLEFSKSPQFIGSVKVLVKMLCETQPLLVSAAIKGISMIGRTVEIPDFDVEIPLQKEDENDDAMDEDKTASVSTKFIIFGVIFGLLRSSSVRAKIREDACKCLGSLAIGDGLHFTTKNLDKFLSLVKVQKDAALNIAISEAIVSTINGYDPSCGPPKADFVNPHCDDKAFEKFLNALVKIVTDPNPNSRQASAVWLLAVVKHCSSRPSVLAKKQLLQFAFTELLSDDSEFVQDVASRGLGLVYSLSDSNSQNDLANSLLDQLIGGKKKVNQVAEDTELFAEGMLGKTPTGGNITTYKELCSLASDLNQPEMIYQFMQLANHNATWTSKLGAAFGLKSISKDAKTKMQPYLGKIIPRLYRYKYDPTPKIQNSMISIWDSIVADSKAVTEEYYWEIMKEILDNLTFNEWRVRIACCLAVRDLIRRSNGLRLRTEEAAKNKKADSMDVDNEVPEPELKELWSQLFRVMDDIHEGTRLAAQGTVSTLSKICVKAASSDHGKSGLAVASSILPLLLETGVGHTVADIRKVSIQTISEMIESSGSLITPHLPSLIPCLLKATGELESSKLSYLSTRLGAEAEAQEAVDSIRAEAAKSHHTMETTAKCIRHVDYAALEKMTPEILELIKSSMNLGTKIACAHFVCLISIRLGKEMTPLVGKYLGACFTGLKDRNATVRKYYASAIGHLMGLAKEQSIKNLFVKLDELYTENPSNRSIALTIQSINKRHHELLKDYTDSTIPLIFYAMHEESNEENKSNIELWKDLWNEVSPGDAGIRLNLNVIIPKLEKSLEDPSWLRKAQSANAINTIAKRLNTTLEDGDRLRLINLLLVALQGRTFQGKERLLQALAGLCKGLDKNHEVGNKIIDAALKECKKEEPQYRTLVLSSLGDILEELEADRFEEVYNMIWYLLDKKDLKNEEDDDMGELNADQRNKRANLFNKLKETVCETLGKSWPKNSETTQAKYQVQFAERCSQCLKDNTRPVQVSLMIALTKFVERLKVFEPETAENKEKKQKVDSSNDLIKEKICTDVLGAVTYASGLPHTGLKKESLNIVLVLIKKLSEAHDERNLALVKKIFEESLQRFEKDSAPEVRCRIKDIEDKLSKIKS
ncbi:proteasome-associated protein ECM29 homolog [Episyrphus balteatus]|uniref:proteasome-associated protein ECM29 homolog n=1 Tax=Episyrphus balteatus TaxID=286459 RepID=UPI0024856C6F|nr:proteasome-associated protein ECM29 homolog [Episyrphus balteatus]